MTEEKVCLVNALPRTSQPDVARNMSVLHDILEARLSPTWNGWSTFSQHYNRILREVLISNDVPIVSLNSRQLENFVSSIVPKPWSYETDTVETYTIPRPVLDLMKQTSEAVLREREQESQRERELLNEMEAVKAFMNTRFFEYDFPRAFVAKAVEILDMHDGVEYMVQALGTDDKWVKLFGQVYRRNEIGLHQFRNTVAYKKYRLVCICSLEVGNPEARFYRGSDDVTLFKRGIPVLSAECASQDGYEITVNSQYQPDFVSFQYHACYHVLDDNPGRIFATAANPGTFWMQLKLPRNRVFNAVQIASRGDEECAPAQSPKEFRIEGSLDGEHWTTLTPSTGSSQGVITAGPWVVGERKTFAFTNEEEYLYYRLVVTSIQGNPHLGLSILAFGNTAML